MMALVFVWSYCPGARPSAAADRGVCLACGCIFIYPGAMSGDETIEEEWTALRCCMVRSTNEALRLSREQLATFLVLFRSLPASFFPLFPRSSLPPTFALANPSSPPLASNPIQRRELRPRHPRPLLRKSSRRPFAHNVTSSYALTPACCGGPAFILDHPSLLL
jgi:hypothetical protein